MGELAVARSFDDAIDALADVQRRKLLVALLEHNPQDVAPDTDRDEAADDDRQIQMEHVHLPKLERYGYIDWDRRSHQVVKGHNFDELRPLLELLDGHESELPQGWV